jgi:hypothetical protein
MLDAIVAKGESIQNPTYTSALRISLYGYVYLLYHFKSPCSIYNTNGSLKSRAWAITFEAPDTLKYPKDLGEQLEDCIKRGTQTIIIALTIYGSDWGHQNALIYKPFLKTIERFEPHGNMMRSSRRPDPQEYDLHFEQRDFNDFNLNSKLTKLFTKTLQSYLKEHTPVFIPHFEVCPLLGLQEIESETQSENETGFCQVWSLWIMHLSLLNPLVETSTLVSTSLSIGNYHPDYFKSLIRGYNALINEEIDDFLKEKGFSGAKSLKPDMKQLNDLLRFTKEETKKQSDQSAKPPPTKLKWTFSHDDYQTINDSVDRLNNAQLRLYAFVLLSYEDLSNKVVVKKANALKPQPERDMRQHIKNKLHQDGMTWSEFMRFVYDKIITQLMFDSNQTKLLIYTFYLLYDRYPSFLILTKLKAFTTKQLDNIFRTYNVDKLVELSLQKFKEYHLLYRDYYEKKQTALMYEKKRIDIFERTKDPLYAQQLRLKLNSKLRTLPLDSQYAVYSWLVENTRPSRDRIDPTKDYVSETVNYMMQHKLMLEDLNFEVPPFITNDNQPSFEFWFKEDVKPRDQTKDVPVKVPLKKTWRERLGWTGPRKTWRERLGWTGPRKTWKEWFGFAGHKSVAKRRSKRRAKKTTRKQWRT